MTRHVHWPLSCRRSRDQTYRSYGLAFLRIHIVPGDAAGFILLVTARLKMTCPWQEEVNALEV